MRKEPRSIELLSPAKDLICGREAINHGADAVYIGGAKFGARYAAGNSAGEIARVVVIRWTIYGSFAITPISIRLVFTWP